MQSVVKSQITRSRSAPPRKNSQKQAEARRRIDLGNERVLQSLMNRWRTVSNIINDSVIVHMIFEKAMEKGGRCLTDEYVCMQPARSQSKTPGTPKRRNVPGDPRETRKRAND
ncbi:unnamed protein product [Haemonchus placei]|uniref:Transposase n=1 Tax=Haemonchus placei TaxID=6290 RepID=A0A0N4W4M0_HAEPC|nr:unnamed protein product [Haemonchus placei]